MQQNQNRSNSNATQFPSARVLAFTLALAAGLAVPAEVQAEFASAGQGIQRVLQGTVSDGALFLETRSTWSNQATPAKPYLVEAWFALPACGAVPVSRLTMTVWGGTASYVCNLGVKINGTDLPMAAPLTFGNTNDANAVFSATAPSVYGAGFGVWLISLPVPGNLLFKEGSSNHVQLTVNTPDSFDGRINQVTLLAVYQAAALNNTFDYVLAEGSGDIYRAPTAPQVDARTVPLGTLHSASATAARLRVLYTYGDLGQNDRLYFNGNQLGGNDVSGWDRAASGLDFGPNVVNIDVLGILMATNAVRFSVAAADVPGTRESSLRPQLAVLEVTSPPAPPALDIALNVVITWPVSADTHQLVFRPHMDSGTWTDVTNLPVVINGQNTLILPRTSPQQFYQLRKTH
jgi:hypothetical protein